MKKRIKQIIGVIIGIIIGISTTVGATTIFNSKDITYSSDKTSKTNVKDSLDELYNKTGKCPEGKWCYNEPKTIADKVELGDYIKMTPTSTSYTPPGELTGCMNDANCTQNTLNPSELNLWRVIKRNNDGTVDMVSVYASSKVVRFRGIVGYMNYVGALNTIASQYTNEKYVERTRYMGYKNQIEYCTDYKVDSCPVDDRKSEDYNLVESILGGIGTLPINGEEHPRYWLPNRMGFFSPRPSGDGYIIDDICTKGDNYLGTQGSRRITSGTETNPVDVTTESSVRPVVSLKSSVFLKNGDGKSAETAYTLV